MAIKARLLQVGLTAAFATTGAFIYQWEGEELKPYKDIAGVKTVCVGHTGKDINMRLYSEQECTDIFVRDIVEASTAVHRCAPKASGPVATAFISFAFNLGEDNFCRSKMVKLYNAGDVKGACHQLTRWVYAGGKFSQGLLNRRLAEQRICFEGVQ